MKVYVLFYDVDVGDRENWNTFHTPCEVFLTSSKRQDRIDQLKTAVYSNGHPCNYEFHELDLDAV